MASARSGGWWQLLGGGAILDRQPVGPPLIIFDAEGRVVRRLGRNGEGPGEFSWSATVAVDRAGAVHVADPILRRLTRWAADGRLIEVQGGAEGRPFSNEQLQQMIAMGQSSCAQIIALQKQALGL